VRQNSDDYQEYAGRSERELRLVVSMEYSGDTYYFTSHGDIDTPAGTSIHGSLKNVNAKTQRYLPDQARSEIGSLNFSLLDTSEEISDLLNDEQFNNDEGPRGREVILWRGFNGLAWADYRKEMTQISDGKISYENGVYDFSCSDKLSQLKKNTFNFPTTRLSAAATADATTLTVYTTTGFDLVPQGTSYGYLPSTSIIMLRIKYQSGWEIVSATGKTATTFTGVVRGIFGTTARAHDLPTDANSDNGVEVEYYPYIELPVAKMVYALLTGVLLNQGGAVLPSTYHLGIAEADIDSASFESYPDWYDTSDDTKGLILAFHGGAMPETDGKAFIEKEILSLINAFLLVEPDGTLSLRRKVAVLSNSDYIGILNEKTISKVNALEHDLDAVSSRFRIRWGYREFGPNSKGFYREKIITDAIAAARFPDSKTKELAFKGLNPARHTSTTLKNIFESQRDAVASPPLHLSGVKLMPTIGFDVELADVFRVDLSNIRDYQSLVDVSSLDRPFEVQRITIDQLKDSVVVDFVGSSTGATQIGDDDNGSAVIPDGSYTGTGTNLTTPLSINGSGFTTSSGTLTGGTTTRTRFYYNGDLTISAGHTITLTGNVELWIKGHLSILGSIDGKGGAGNSNALGYIGTTRSQGPAIAKSSGKILFLEGATYSGLITAIPALMITNDAGVIAGYPADMRGTGGPDGGNSRTPASATVAGGDGGDGGSSLVIVSRGMSFGVSGEIDVSGDDGVLGATGDYVHGGSGGGGSGGSVLILIDGSGNSVPIATGKVVIFRGSSPEQGNIPERGVDYDADQVSPSTRWSGFIGSPAVSQYDSNLRIQYLPVSRTPYENDQAAIESASSVTVTPIAGGNDIDWNNPTDPTSWDLMEVHASTTNDIDTSSKIYEGRASRTPHITGTLTPQFYWLRSRSALRFSAFLPATTTTTYTGTPLVDAVAAALTSNWSGVIDNDSNRPDNNATSGAPPGTQLNGVDVDLITGSFHETDEDGSLSLDEDGSISEEEELGQLALKQHSLSQSIIGVTTALSATVAALDLSLTGDISDINALVANLVESVVDLTSGVAGIYIQDDEPVAGVAGIPDPIPALARWYESDNSNHPYYWNGSSFVSLADGRTGINAANIILLQASQVLDSGNVSLNADAIALLDTTLVTANGTISSISSDLIELTNDISFDLDEDGTISLDEDDSNSELESTESMAIASSSASRLLESRVDITDAGLVVESSERLALAALLQTETDTRVAVVLAETNARVSADSAEATARGIVATIVGDHTAAISTNLTSINGILGKYTLVVDANGNIASIELLAGTDGTSMKFLANVIQFIDPDNPTDPGVLPITFSEGVAVLQDVVIQGNLLVNGSVDFATHIGGAEKPQDNATKNTGLLQADTYVLSVNDGHASTAESDIDTWALGYDGSAPITLVSSTEFQFDEDGQYLVTFVFDISHQNVGSANDPITYKLRTKYDDGSGYSTISLATGDHSSRGTGSAPSSPEFRVFGESQALMVTAVTDDKLKFTFEHNGFNATIFKDTNSITQVTILKLKQVTD